MERSWHVRNWTRVRRVCVIKDMARSTTLSDRIWREWLADSWLHKSAYDSQRFGNPITVKDTIKQQCPTPTNQDMTTHHRLHQNINNKQWVSSPHTINSFRCQGQQWFGHPITVEDTSNSNVQQIKALQHNTINTNTSTMSVLQARPAR